MITKLNPDLQQFFSEQGAPLLIDKPYKWSSFKVIHEIRKRTAINKAGHAGTLDPHATGLLIVCASRATKTINSFQDLNKQYTGTVCLGKSTPSMDTETEVNSERAIDHITAALLEETVKSFTGSILQVPPMYSACNFNGKKLYLLARKGKTIEREPRRIVVETFEITAFDPPYFSFKVTCSKGTYIRVLANDIGEALNCGGHLTELRRTMIGPYSVDDAFLPHEFTELASENGYSKIKPDTVRA